MKKGLLMLIICSCFFEPIMAQYQISGIVTDQNYKPLEYATVVVYPVSDSTQIRGVVTNSSGFFKFENFTPSNYTIVVQMLGFEDYEKEMQLFSNIKQMKIRLIEDTVNLGEVEIIAEISQLESRLGKKVLRIGKDLSNTGSTAFEAIEKVPSVTTSVQGGVQIRGSSNIIIYVNGKETKRNVSTLKYISADVLEKIEVITNPSAKFDAEGVGGIINIVYKKDTRSRLKLENILNLSVPKRYSTGFNIALNKNKFSVYTNFVFGKSWNEYENKTDRINFNSELSRYENNIKFEGVATSPTLNSGITFEPDSTFSMNLEINYNRWDDEGEHIQKNKFLYDTNTVPEVVSYTSRSNELEDESSIGFSLNKVYNSNRKLQIQLSISGEDEENSSNYDTVNIEEIPIEGQQYLKSSIETESQRFYQGKLDYEAPFLKFGTFETGVKMDHIKYDIFQKTQLQADLMELPDNDFSVKMNKYSAYFLHNKEFEKLEYSLGVRFEHFYSSGFQQSNNEMFIKKSTKLFPSIQFQYMLDGSKHTIGISYTRRINNPSFFDINPYLSFQDPLNLQTGNPDLEPELANLYELNYHLNFGSFSTDVTLYNRKIINVIQNAFTLLNENQTLETFENFNNRIDQGVEVQIEYSTKKVFKAYATFLLSHARFNNKDSVILNNSISCGIRLNQQLNFNRQWLVKVAQIYTAPRFEPQRKILSRFYIDFTLSKKFNNKGSVTLNIADILNTRVFASELHGNSFQIDRSFKAQTRRVTLGLRYNILN